MQPQTVLASLFFATAASAGVLNFEDINIPNEPSNCGSHFFAPAVPYHGFSITPASVADVALVYNTTSTRYCHQSSGGGGPWGKAFTNPNVLYATGGNVSFSRPHPFSISELHYDTLLHFTALNQDPAAKIIFTFEGRKKYGGVVKTTRVVDKDSLLGPFLVGLKGFVGLERFLVSTRLVTVAVGVGPASIYLDGIVYKD